MENILRFLDLGKQDYEQYKKSISFKGASVVNMNQSAEIPQNYHTKKNKNDFYRFLLAQNKHHQGISTNEFKVNNDVLIPRSILKKNGEQLKNRKKGYLNYSDSEAFDMYGNPIIQDDIV